MCGIAGFIDERLNAQEASAMIGTMLENIAHRGPDARSTWTNGPVVLGHNRLSILDLSPDGTQPMFHFGCRIIFNGEIYNYIEIREELKKSGYTFKTGTDTEVVLAAYRHFGRDCVQKFVGMWSFAIWDEERQELFCSRDRFGIKPFYYIFENGRFYFGSEYRAVKPSPVFTNSPNIAQIGRGLQLGWICYDDETYFEKIKALPAAHNLVYTKGELKIERYWDIDLTKKYTGTEEQAFERFRELFIDSILLHMRADVEVGGCLSGGIDSSSIASVVADRFPQLSFKTFTIYYEGKNEVDERPWVRKVLQKYPSLDPYDYSPGEKEIADHFDSALKASEVPMAGSSPMSQYFVMKLAASKKIKVLLDGQGSDEYLAGYMHSFYRHIAGMLRNLALLKAHKEFYAHSGSQEYGMGKMADSFLKSMLSVFQSEQSLYELEYKKYFPFLMKDEAVHFSLKKKSNMALDNFLYHLTFTTSLPSLLHYEDRNSMAFSIESRVPFLDHRLVEFVFSLDPSLKFYRGITKRALRESLKQYLPADIYSRKDKKGFVTPGEIKWLRGPLKHLLEQDMSQLTFLNVRKSEAVISKFKSGDNKNANLVWRLAVLNRWYSTCR